MNKLNILIVHSLMNAMYDREKDLHPADAYKLASRLMANDETVKNLIIYIVSNHFSTRSFIIGIGCGIALGLMLAIIIINVC